MGQIECVAVEGLDASSVPLGKVSKELRAQNQASAFLRFGRMTGNPEVIPR
jgi:hypothetical protein